MTISPICYPSTFKLILKKEEDWKHGRLNFHYLRPRNYYLLFKNAKRKYELKWLHFFHLPQQYDICHVIYIFVLYYKQIIAMANFSIFVPLIYHIPMTCGVLPSFSNKTFYRYGGHFELMRFKECYRMPRDHVHDSIYSLPIYARFSDQSSLSFPRKRL